MQRVVDVLLCLPDLMDSAFVTETLMPLFSSPVARRFLTRPGLRSEYAREILLHQFLEDKESEYVFILDADMILPPQTLPRLLWHKKKMITGLYWSRGEVPNYPVIHEVEPLDKWPKSRYLRYPKDGKLFEVGSCGHGCLLIHRSVLEKMTPPFSQLGPYGGEEIVGSDIRLCKKAREEAGVKIWCDPLLRCGHLRPRAITEEDWLEHEEDGIKEWEQNLQHHLKMRELLKYNPRGVKE